MLNNLLYYYLPKGRAFEGDNFKQLINAYNIVIEEYIVQPVLDFENELYIDTASPETILLMFNEINTRNLFPQVDDPEDYKLILKLFQLPRAWVTRDDIIDMMLRIKYTIEFIDPVDVYNNPDNYPQLTYKPQSLEEAYFIIYYKLIPIVEGGGLKFPLKFPITFGGAKRKIADKLIREVVDGTILLVSYD